MIETALELGGDEVPASVIRGILDAGKALHAHPVELFDGIKETLAALAERARLVLVTKGDLFHQETKLAASGLGDLFTGIEIVSDKRPETFAGIFKRNDVRPSSALMAGDSMRSDVFPALEAGAWAAYIPQPLGWSHEQRPAPSDHPRFVELPSLAALVNWLDRAEAA
jgi:putative hydrolase of the HAD superfamily